MKEASTRLGVNSNTLYKDVVKAVEQGWLQFSNPHDLLEYQILPKVARNLNEFIEDRDRTVTLETAKGTLFKTFLDSKGVRQDGQTTVLALKLELPEGASTAVTGKIVGRPRAIEAEVISNAVQVREAAQVPMAEASRTGQAVDGEIRLPSVGSSKEE